MSAVIIASAFIRASPRRHESLRRHAASTRHASIYSATVCRLLLRALLCRHATPVSHAACR